MPQRLELRLRTPVPRRYPRYQQEDCVVQPKSPVDNPTEYDSGDPQLVMFDAHRDNVVVDDPGPYVGLYDLQGK